MSGTCRTYACVTGTTTVTWFACMSSIFACHETVSSAASQPAVSLAFLSCVLRSGFFGFKLLEKLFPLPGKRAISGKLKGLQSESLEQRLPMGILGAVVAEGLGRFFGPSRLLRPARSRVSWPFIPHDEPLPL